MTDDAQHLMGTRRFNAHITSVWCSCGWKLDPPSRLVTKQEMTDVWQKHLEPTDG